MFIIYDSDASLKHILLQLQEGYTYFTIGIPLCAYDNMVSYNPEHKYYYSTACIQNTSNGYKISLAISKSTDSSFITEFQISIGYAEVIVFYI